MNLEPKLLLQWEPRWKGFTSSLAPAFARSQRRLTVECEGPATSPRSLVSSLGFHLLLIAMIWIAPGAVRPRVVITESPTPTQITYYSGPYLPKMEDASGAESGKSGKSGGNEGFHPKQIIRVSRGRAADDRNIDAPKLRLAENSSLANLIAVASAAPAPPAEAIRKRLSPSQFNSAVSEVVPPPVETPQLKTKMKMAEIRAFSSPTQVIQPVQENVVRNTLSASKLILPEAGVVQPAPDIAKLRSRQSVPTQELVSAAVPPVPQFEQVTHGLPNISAPDVAAVQPAPSMEQLSSTNSRVSRLADLVSKPADFDTSRANGNGTSKSAVGATDSAGDGDHDQKIQALIISANPGNTAGLPTKTENGSVALSPNGTATKGLGGSGGGAGIAKGPDSGSGKNGLGPGSAQSGVGPAADQNARNGTSMKSGLGGTGDGTAKNSTLAGITISGGSVSLPSFGPANIPSGSAGKVLGPRHPPSIMIVGSSSAGGALNRYRTLKGGKVYTIYIQTRLGTAVLEYAEQAANAGSFEEDLTAPEPTQSDFPADVQTSRMVVACVIGRDGVLRNLRVLESAAAEKTAKLLTALGQWRFRPVLRGDEAIAVDAILGFDIDTR